MTCSVRPSGHHEKPRSTPGSWSLSGESGRKVPPTGGDVQTPRAAWPIADHLPLQVARLGRRPGWASWAVTATPPGWRDRSLKQDTISPRLSSTDLDQSRGPRWLLVRTSDQSRNVTAAPGDPPSRCFCWSGRLQGDLRPMRAGVPLRGWDGLIRPTPSIRPTQNRDLTCKNTSSGTDGTDWDGLGVVSGHPPKSHSA